MGLFGPLHVDSCPAHCFVRGGEENRLNFVEVVKMDEINEL